MKRLKNRSGFTLAETLLAVLIMLLVTVIMTNGIPAARTAYEKVVLGANAQAMLSTAVTALRDELTTAWQVKKVDATTLEYFNADTGAVARLSLDTEGTYPAILRQYYIAAEDDLIHGSTASQGEARHLVPDESARLYVTYESIDVGGAGTSTSEGETPTVTDANIVTVNGLAVCKKADGEAIVELKNTDGTAIGLQIRLLSEDIETDA